MKIRICCVGKIREAGLRAVMDDYVDRIRRYVPCEEIEVRDDTALERAIERQALVVACEVLGEATTSAEFARRLARWGGQGKGDVAFVIGGAEGIPRPLSENAAARLSLSRMTLPHRLARVLLAEQIYRAFTILRGEPYSSK